MANPSQPAVTLTPKQSGTGSQPAITLTKVGAPGSTGSLKDATFELANGWHVTLYSRNSNGTKHAIQLTAEQMDARKVQLEDIFTKLKDPGVDTFNGILKADGGVRLKEGTNVRSVAPTDVQGDELARAVSAVGAPILAGIKSGNITVNSKQTKTPSSSKEKSTTQSSKGAAKPSKTGKGSNASSKTNMNRTTPYHKLLNGDISSKDLTVDTAFSTDTRQSNLSLAVDQFGGPGGLTESNPEMTDDTSIQSYLNLLKLNHPNKAGFEYIFTTPGDFAPSGLKSLADRGRALVKNPPKTLILPVLIDGNHFGVIAFQKNYNYGTHQYEIIPLVYNPTGNPLLSIDGHEGLFTDEHGHTITPAILRTLAQGIFGDTVTVEPPINYSTHKDRDGNLDRADHQVPPDSTPGVFTNHCAGYCTLLIENLVSNVGAHQDTPFDFDEYCTTEIPVGVVQAHARLVARDLQVANDVVQQAVERNQDRDDAYQAKKALNNGKWFAGLGSKPKFSLTPHEKDFISTDNPRFRTAGGHLSYPLTRATTDAAHAQTNAELIQAAAQRREDRRLAAQQASVPASGGLLGKVASLGSTLVSGVSSLVGGGAPSPVAVPKAKPPLKPALKKQPPQPAPQPQASSLSRGNVGSAGVGATIAGLTAAGLGLSAAPVVGAALVGAYLGKIAYGYATQPTQPPASAPQSAPAPQPQAPQPKSAPALQPQAAQPEWDFVAANDDEDYPMHPQEAHAAAPLARREPAALNRAALERGDASTPPLVTPPRKPRGRVQKAVRFDDVPKVNTFTVSHVGKRKVPKLGQKKAGAPKTLVPVTSQVPVTSHVSSIEDVD